MAMKAVLSAGALRKAISLASKASDPSHTNVAYTGVQLVVRSETLQATGSDGSKGTITASADLKSGKDGSILIQPKPLITFLETFSAGEELSLESEERSDLKITAAGKPPYSFKALVATFPKPVTAERSLVDADLSQFAAAVNAITAPALPSHSMGVEFRIQEGKLRITSTDNLRIHQAVLEAKGEDQRPISVNFRPMLAQARTLEFSQIGLSPNGQAVTLKGDEVEVTGIARAKAFPQTDAYMNSVPPHYYVQLASKELITALTRMSVVSPKSIKLSLKGQRLSISGSNIERGTGEEEVEFLDDPAEGEFECLVDPTHMLDAVSAQVGDRVTVGYSLPAKPMFFSSKTDIEVVCMVSLQVF